jgi:hypothetical protein
MYVLTTNGVIETYPYSIGDLRRDNPQTSFPRNPSLEALADFGVYPVTPVERPAFDPITQNLIEEQPILVGGDWTQVWAVSSATPEEIEQRRAIQLQSLKEQRAAAYRNEADPIFFKAQRGEAMMEEWEAKVEEIRARFPYPEVQA